MVEIIPAINVTSWDEVKNKVSLVEPYVQWVHIDVADGTFTENVLWHTPADLANLDTPLLLEIHLMINTIDTRIQEWLLPKVERVIFHAEVSHDPQASITLCHNAGKQAGVAIKPDTRVDEILPYAGKADMLQVLGVVPGKSGQVLQENALSSISTIRQHCPSCVLEIDGGMNLQTVPMAVNVGANVIVAASAIFESENIEEAIKKLKEAGNAQTA